jgi:hypothetical protein
MAYQPHPLQQYVNKDRSGVDSRDGGERGSYDDEFGSPGYVGNNTNSEQDQASRRSALGAAIEGGGDYSNDAAEKRKRYYAWAAEHGMEGSNSDPNVFINPGSADWGGDQGVAFYRDAAAAAGKQNDAAQATNEAAMRRSFVNMTGDRGTVYSEDAGLSGASAATRAEQLNALNLSRDAAMGLAPSEAAYQTKIGMNDIAAARSSQMGGARGLSALGGAQTMGSAAAGQSAGNLAMQGGLARSKEIADAVGMYGTQAGTVRDQDLSRLGLSNQNSMFNAKLNDDWKMGNANLLAQQGNLGNAQSGVDLGWMGEQYRGQDKQFQYDQEMAAKEAGADADAVGAALAKNRESRENTRQLVNGGVVAGATAVGTAFGGPVGGAAGSTAGQAFGSASKDWDW